MIMINDLEQNNYKYGYNNAILLQYQVISNTNMSQYLAWTNQHSSINRHQDLSKCITTSSIDHSIKFYQQHLDDYQYKQHNHQLNINKISHINQYYGDIDLINITNKHNIKLDNDIIKLCNDHDIPDNMKYIIARNMTTIDNNKVDTSLFLEHISVGSITYQDIPDIDKTYIISMKDYVNKYYVHAMTSYRTIQMYNVLQNHISIFNSPVTLSLTLYDILMGRFKCTLPLRHILGKSTDVGDDINILQKYNSKLHAFRILQHNKLMGRIPPLRLLQKGWDYFLIPSLQYTKEHKVIELLSYNVLIKIKKMNHDAAIRIINNNQHLKTICPDNNYAISYLTSVYTDISPVDLDSLIIKDHTINFLNRHPYYNDFRLIIMKEYNKAILQQINTNMHKIIQHNHKKEAEYAGYILMILANISISGSYKISDCTFHHDKQVEAKLYEIINDHSEVDKMERLNTQTNNLIRRSVAVALSRMLSMTNKYYEKYYINQCNKNYNTNKYYQKNNTSIDPVLLKTIIDDDINNEAQFIISLLCIDLILPNAYYNDHCVYNKRSREITHKGTGIPLDRINDEFASECAKIPGVNKTKKEFPKRIHFHNQCDVNERSTERSSFPSLIQCCCSQCNIPNRSIKHIVYNDACDLTLFTRCINDVCNRTNCDRCNYGRTITPIVVARVKNRNPGPWIDTYNNLRAIHKNMLTKYVPYFIVDKYFTIDLDKDNIDKCIISICKTLEVAILEYDFLFNVMLNNNPFNDYIKKYIVEQLSELNIPKSSIIHEQLLKRINKKIDVGEIISIKSLDIELLSCKLCFDIIMSITSLPLFTMANFNYCHTKIYKGLRDICVKYDKISSKMIDYSYGNQVIKVTDPITLFRLQIGHTSIDQILNDTVQKESNLYHHNNTPQSINNKYAQIWNEVLSDNFKPSSIYIFAIDAKQKQQLYLLLIMATILKQGREKTYTNNRQDLLDITHEDIENSYKEISEIPESMLEDEKLFIQLKSMASNMITKEMAEMAEVVNINKLKSLCKRKYKITLNEILTFNKKIKYVLVMPLMYKNTMDMKQVARGVMSNNIYTTQSTRKFYLDTDKYLHEILNLSLDICQNNIGKASNNLDESYDHNSIYNNWCAGKCKGPLYHKYKCDKCDDSNIQLSCMMCKKTNLNLMDICNLTHPECGNCINLTCNICNNPMIILCSNQTHFYTYQELMVYENVDNQGYHNRIKKYASLCNIKPNDYLVPMGARGYQMNENIQEILFAQTYKLQSDTTIIYDPIVVASHADNCRNNKCDGYDSDTYKCNISESKKSSGILLRTRIKVLGLMTSASLCITEDSHEYYEKYLKDTLMKISTNIISQYHKHKKSIKTAFSEEPKNLKKILTTIYQQSNIISIMNLVNCDEKCNKIIEQPCVCIHSIMILLYTESLKVLILEQEVLDIMMYLLHLYREKEGCDNNLLSIAIQQLESYNYDLELSIYYESYAKDLDTHLCDSGFLLN